LGAVIAEGSIAAGKLADFVVVAGDPHGVDPNRIEISPSWRR
jgi:imidazolonepropionase-like amidohydrolase